MAPHAKGPRGRNPKPSQEDLPIGSGYFPPTAQSPNPQASDDLDGERIDFARLKTFAQTVNRPLGSLIALDDGNDPFLADRPGRRKDGAEWFAALWNRLDIPEGVHLRRLHYLLVSTTGITLPNGAPYENTHKSWKDLALASRDARYLDLVPAGAFVDRRAAEPVIYMPDDAGSDASILIHASQPTLAGEDEDCAELHYDPPCYEFPDLPGAYLCEPHVVDPYAIELWAEKSTMNDILLPLAKRRDVTLITGVGELSATHCHAVVRRVREHGRKTRILYISDHDPSGDGMPVSVARKIEFFLRRDGGDLDIRLDPLILTAEQVSEYRLPRVPIKDSDLRRAQFEARHGTGAVELDALEALHRGALREIVEAAIDRFRKPVRSLRSRIATKANAVRRQIKDVEERVLDAHAEAIGGLRQAWEETESEIVQHQEAITAAIERCEQMIAGHAQAITELREDWQERAEPIWQQIASDIEQEVPDPAEIEWPALNLDEEPDPLFDSNRDYVEQIDRYKQHQGKPIARRQRNGGGGV
jgi:hypothetical protein